MELNKKCNYNCHSNKPWYLVRMVQDFYCYPSYYENENKCEHHKEDKCKCRCNDYKEERFDNSYNDNRNSFNWEQEFERKYWNDQYQEFGSKNSRNCCNKRFY